MRRYTVMRMVTAVAMTLGYGALAWAQLTAEEVEAALQRGEVPAQLLGYREVEPPAPETLPPERIVGSAERLALCAQGGPTGNLLTAVSLPAKFDLRDEGAVTPPRNQNPWGTCWMFASMGSFESCLLKMYGEKADFSEWNCLTNNLWLGRDILNAGGNPSRAEALLNDLFGPPLEVQDKYQTSRPSTMTHQPLAPARLLKEVVYLYPPYNPTTNSYDLQDADYLRQIKELIYNYGAVTTAFYSHGNYWNSSNTAYYYSDTDVTKANHAVLLIGWDDTYSKSNFKTSPSRDGAWLVKNSWGSFCDYFYISYDDPIVNRYGQVAQFRPEDPALGREISRIYRWEPGDNCRFSHITDCQEVSIASVFTAQHEALLHYVHFDYYQPYGGRIDYTLSVYGEPETEKPSTGTLLAKQQGYLFFDGPQRLPLQEALHLTQGMRFAIVLSFSSVYSTRRDVYFPADINAQNAGCTFFAQTSKPDASTTWIDSTSSVGNIGLRAMVGPTVASRSSLMNWLKAAGYARESIVAAATDTQAAEPLLTVATGVIDYDRAVEEMEATAETTSGLTPWECYLAGTLPDEPLTLTPRLTFDEAGKPVLSPDPELIGRTYILYSKAALEDAWTTDEDLSGKHFFKYRVSWPEATEKP